MWVLSLFWWQILRVHFMLHQSVRSGYKQTSLGLGWGTSRSRYNWSTVVWTFVFQGSVCRVQSSQNVKDMSEWHVEIIGMFWRSGLVRHLWRLSIKKNTDTWQVGECFCSFTQGMKNCWPRPMWRNYSVLCIANHVKVSVFFTITFIYVVVVKSGIFIPQSDG